MVDIAQAIQALDSNAQFVINGSPTMKLNIKLKLNTFLVQMKMVRLF